MGNLAKGDEGIGEFTRRVDDFIARYELDFPPEPSSAPAQTQAKAASMRHLELDAAGVRSVVWATGYRYDFSWIRCAVFDGAGKPVHRRGVSGVCGLYFLGLPRLHKIKSAFLWGVGEDAAYLAEHIAARG